MQLMTLGQLPCLVATQRRPYVQVSVMLVPFRDSAISRSLVKNQRERERERERERKMSG
jgi:hypothetical protein